MFIIIAGAGLIGSQITKSLVNNKHDVVVIDYDKDVCERIYAETGAMTVNGNATDLSVLEEAGVGKADTLLCLMREDADNISCTLLAKSLGCKRVVAFVRKKQYLEAYKIADVDALINLTDLIIDQVIMEVEKPKVRRIMRIGGGKASIYAINIPKKAKVSNKKIKDIAQNKHFPQECVFIGLYREKEDHFLIPRGNNVISENDTVFVVSNTEFIKKASDFLTK
ncbi:MAG: trk/ktr system potassium uptake protein [Candidatus Cloacimonadota bacterium]|jgi:trk system potassium uptake protein TrkA|nr:trk/ktr system potassium uptake protein [Candidatus Cloacimonadota bacterium]